MTFVWNTKSSNSPGIVSFELNKSVAISANSDNENVLENSTAQTVYLQNKEDLKHIVFEKSDKNDSKLLNEDNIKDLGN